MDSTALRHLLVNDWAELENNPLRLRRPAQVELWHGRAERLALMVGRSIGELAPELKAEAERVAARRRQELLGDLARDLAVSRALGQSLRPPWRRRLDQLTQAMDQPKEKVRSLVEKAAAKVEVVVKV